MMRLTTVLCLTMLVYTAGVAYSQNTPGAAASSDLSASEPAGTPEVPEAEVKKSALEALTPDDKDSPVVPDPADVPEPAASPAAEVPAVDVDVKVTPPAAVPGAAVEPATDTPQLTLKQLQAKIAALQAEMTKLKAEDAALRAELAAHQKAITAGTESVAKLIPLVDRNVTSIEALRERAAAAETRLDDHRTRILAAGRLADENDIKLRAIAVPDGSGSYMVDLSSKMELSPTFKRQVQRTLQGKLRIYNRADYPRTLYINGTAWSARPGWSYIWVPVGPVIVHRTAGSEAETSDDWEQISNSTTPEWVIRYKF